MGVDIDPTGTRITVPGRDGQPLAIDSAAADPTLVRLTAGGAEATVYPGVGFNLVDWRVPVDGAQVQALHADPDALSGGSGTRSGQPILFPFPNRIADATYDWSGRTYRLAVAHPGDRHAIHGFAAKRAWQTYEQTGDSAVTGEFLLSRDAADAVANWPGDLRLRVTFDLAEDSLTVTATVTNADDHPVPFGLGYHPYFAPLRASSADDLVVSAGASGYWVLDGRIPTGVVAPVEPRNDLRMPVALGDRNLDDVLTDLDSFQPGAGGLMERANIVGGDARLSIACDEQFRDLVVFTPDSRASFAVEPYTCPTDAVHLERAGHDVGWRVLAPGESWSAVVRYRLGPA